MFRDDYYYIPSQAEIEYQHRIYQQKKAAIEESIIKEQEKLNAWLDNKENRARPHYGIVEEIFNCMHRTNSNENENLDFYRDRRDDMEAVNAALSGAGTNALEERATANMVSKSPGLQITGILFTMLAVALLIASICTLNPFLLFFGAIAAATALITFQIGSIKVSTEKSTLFNSLKESISPTPAPRMDVTLMSFEDESLLYARYW